MCVRCRHPCPLVSDIEIVGQSGRPCLGSGAVAAMWFERQTSDPEADSVSIPANDPPIQRLFTAKVTILGSGRSLFSS
jgi:hypothetical protein